jgi:3-methyl-2-oxobutanoate hydroxymethyltransferase
LQQALQKERVGGFKDFIQDVNNGSFPSDVHTIKAADSLVDDFLRNID